MATPKPDGSGDGGAALDDELEHYVRRSVIQAIAGILLLVMLVGACGILFEAEFLAATQWVYEAIGVAGLLAILFVSDSLITPVPPDLLLVVVAKSDLRATAWTLLPAMGCVSVLAGNVAWLLATRLGNVRAVLLVFGRLRVRHQRLVGRYGRLAVALGALTPIPFSVTCWAAGLMKMSFHDLWPATLLRVPRFYLYYWIITSSDRIVQLFFF